MNNEEEVPHRCTYPGYSYTLLGSRFYLQRVENRWDNYEKSFDQMGTSLPRGRRVVPTQQDEYFLRITPLPPEDVAEIELLLEGEIPLDYT